MRAKDVLFKKNQYMKTKHEKRVGKLQDKIEYLNNKIAEQDKVTSVVNVNHWVGNQIVPDQAQGLHQEQSRISQHSAVHGNRATAYAQAYPN